MSNTLILVLLVLVLVALAFLVRQSAILATRLDRLHWRILTTRDSLALLLDERARYSERIADYPGFTSDESQEIREASTRARRQMIPLVADGLDRRTSEASIRDTQTREKVIEFFDIQSQLSRILRSALNVKLRKEIDADDYWSRELRELDQASYKVQLARSMHNLYVTQAHKIRERSWVRIAHLAGHAPMAQTIDFDDDTIEDGYGY